MTRVHRTTHVDGKPGKHLQVQVAMIVDAARGLNVRFGGGRVGSCEAALGRARCCNSEEAFHAAASLNVADGLQAVIGYLVSVSEH
ncbi:hypothetical protein LY39_02201 [Roseinatronobacter bogoriensis subsp. barguzinensis]|nr:hypothetical protein [Rhodobaca bogoriensis DSM 18756]TDW37848.1 hypothetical protein LY39_02201 [Rhodobaca barguzinensis]TDY69983.1 hypothetical protein EV660_103379 [Rhodobaca bogoriensis DSM 18756]